MRALDFASMPVDRWPAQDRARWEAAQDLGTSPFGGGGAVGWRPASVKAVEVDYGRWLFRLERRGALAPSASPAERATIQQVAAYHADLVAAGYSEFTVAGRLRHLGDALRVLDPDHDTKFINRGARRLIGRASRAKPIAPRMRSSQELSDLGRHLREQARGDPDPDWRSAKLFRDGLLVGFWALRPLRISNIAALRLGETLVEVGGNWRFVFEAADMKGKRQFGGAWPLGLLNDLEDYQAIYRPLLAARGKQRDAVPGLWLSSRGGALKLDSVAGIITDRTQAAFGLSVNPHLIRHIVATEIAEGRPTQVTDIAALLHHTGIETSERYYNKAGPYRAAQAYDRLLQQKRRELSHQRRRNRAAAEP